MTEAGDPLSDPLPQSGSPSGQSTTSGDASQLWLSGHPTESSSVDETDADAPAGAGYLDGYDRGPGIGHQPAHDRTYSGEHDRVMAEEARPLDESDEVAGVDVGRPKGVHRAPRRRAKIFVLGLFGALLAVLLAAAMVAANGSSDVTEGVAPQASSDPSVNAEPTSGRGRGNTERGTAPPTPTVPAPSPGPPSIEPEPTPAGGAPGRPSSGPVTSSPSRLADIDIQITITFGP